MSKYDGIEYIFFLKNDIFYKNCFLNKFLTFSWNNVCLRFFSVLFYWTSLSILTSLFFQFMLFLYLISSYTWLKNKNAQRPISVRFASFSLVEYFDDWYYLPWCMTWATAKLIWIISITWLSWLVRPLELLYPWLT